jgi:hypothetical protein
MTDNPLETIEDSVEEQLEEQQTIGKMNGKWAVLFKTLLVALAFCIPTMFTWGVWVTNSAYASKFHIESTSTLLDRIEFLEKNSVTQPFVIQELSKISKKIDNLPPLDWRRRVETLENEYEVLSKDIINMDKNNTSDHVQIKTLLESITKKLDNLNR